MLVHCHYLWQQSQKIYSNSIARAKFLPWDNHKMVFKEANLICAAFKTDNLNLIIN